MQRVNLSQFQMKASKTATIRQGKTFWRFILTITETVIYLNLKI